ncbi:MAG: hypothetical protein ABL984_05310, partial [Pyrinomonadaceae bacterium]
ENTQICWSEEEAAEVLKISTETLAKIRKRNEIGHTYAIPPTSFAKGKPANGRPVYLRHHLLNYLLRFETHPTAKERIRFENVYPMFEKAA